jgi:hypothetical protein
VPPGTVLRSPVNERTTVARDARADVVEAGMLRPSLRLNRTAGPNGPAAGPAGVPEAGHERKERP